MVNDHVMPTDRPPDMRKPTYCSDFVADSIIETELSFLTMIPGFTSAAAELTSELAILSVNNRRNRGEVEIWTDDCAYCAGLLHTSCAIVHAYSCRFRHDPLTGPCPLPASKDWFACVPDRKYWAAPPLHVPLSDDTRVNLTPALPAAAAVDAYDSTKQYITSVSCSGFNLLATATTSPPPPCLDPVPYRCRKRTLAPEVHERAAMEVYKRAI